ncbi:MAG: hypothetical protein Q4G68_01105 [Planctomycetia bacterium]|nr:hypothetical protein [Planctomycetia bacterium]
MSTQFWKRTVDIFMIGLFIALMGCSFTGDVVHECLGILLFVLFIAHHVLNRTWYQTFMSRRRSPRQLAFALMTVLLFTVVVFMAISSILVSRTIFAFIDYDGGLFSRQLHQMTTHLALMLAAIHFGLYGKRFFGRWTRLSGTKQISKWFAVAVPLAVICLYGIWACYRHDVGQKLLMRQAYSFWSGSRITFFVDYTAIFISCSILAFSVERFTSKK